MVLGAYRELVADLRTSMSKTLFKAAVATRAIPLGVDNRVFRPMLTEAGDPSREELRETFFNGQVTTDDLVVMVSGHKTRRKGIPQACALVSSLRQLVDRPVKLYFHMPCLASASAPIQVSMFAAACDLDPEKDILYGDEFFDPAGRPLLSDERLNYLYNAVDLVLCPDLANGWPFTATEAIAAGTPVAAPADHVWLDAVGQRGIELPCTEFGWAPWGAGEYARAIDPHASALKVAEVFNDQDKLGLLIERGIYWAVADSSSSWDTTAERWSDIFGVSRL